MTNGFEGFKNGEFVEQERDLEQKIANASSFRELFEVIDSVEGIYGSPRGLEGEREWYSKEEVNEKILEVLDVVEYRAARIDIDQLLNQITRAYGLRGTVKRLLTEKREYFDDENRTNERRLLINERRLLIFERQVMAAETLDQVEECVRGADENVKFKSRGKEIFGEEIIGGIKMESGILRRELEEGVVAPNRTRLITRNYGLRLKVEEVTFTEWMSGVEGDEAREKALKVVEHYNAELAQRLRLEG